MRIVTPLMICLCLVSGLARAGDPPSDWDRYWPQWRGPRATGVAPHGDPPVEWSESRNLRWKVAIPGRGSSSPVVWGDRVFVTTAVPVGSEQPPKPEEPRRPGPPRSGKPTIPYKFTVLALHRGDGRILWQRVAREEIPHEGTHPESGTFASNSAVTDGERVVAFFGSRGLYCYDMEGELQWKRDLGDMTIRFAFGEGSSPVLYDDRIIINWDHERQSFIVALDKRTGKELWKTLRDEGSSWATPVVVEDDGTSQVISSATRRIRSYDVETGTLIWEASGMTLNTIPSPVAAHGMVYAISGFRGNSLMAIRLDGAKGDITGTDSVVWRHDRDTPYVPSPLLYGDQLYFLKHNSAILSVFDAETGQELYGRQRLEGIRSVYASPVGANDRVYLAGRAGTILVIKHGARFEVLATNSLDDGFDASPAIVDGELYLRGRSHLYCLAESSSD